MADIRLTVCRSILSMLGDEKQAPTIRPESAHIDREAWEPCEECEKRNCDNCIYSEYLSNMEPCKSCYNAKEWKPISRFCSECGRPITDEAWAELEKRMSGVSV